MPVPLARVNRRLARRWPADATGSIVLQSVQLPARSDKVAATGHLYWPLVGSRMATSGHFAMATDR